MSWETVPYVHVDFPVFQRVLTVGMKYDLPVAQRRVLGVLSVFEKQVLLCKSQISFLISHLAPGLSLTSDGWSCFAFGNILGSIAGCLTN